MKPFALAAALIALPLAAHAQSIDEARASFRWNVRADPAYGELSRLGLPAGSTLAQRLALDYQRFALDVARMDDAGVQRWAKARLDAIAADKKAWFERVGSNWEARRDLEVVLAGQERMLRDVANAPDAKKKLLAWSEGMAKQMKRVAVEEAITRDLPGAKDLADRTFQGKDDAALRSAAWRYDEIEGLASTAANASALAKDVLAILKEDPDAIGRFPKDRVVDELNAVVKQNDERLAKLRAGWEARKKAPKYDGPSIGLPGRPVPPPRYLSVEQMVADGLIPGTGAADKVGSRVGLGVVTRPLHAVNWGYQLGGYYQNSALMNFQMAERARMRREYERKLADWEKNVKPLVIENERREREEAAKAAAQELRILFALNGGSGWGGSRFTDTVPGAVSPLTSPTIRAGQQR